jgi:hypothetical protein
MDENTIMELWRSSNEKLEESHVSISKNTEDIARLKVRGLLSSMKPIKLFALITGIIWVGAGIVMLVPLYLHSFSEANKYFLFSATIQIGLTGLALCIYLYQLITIHRSDVTAPILEAQKELASLKKSTLWVTRILILQLPVWTTFYWNDTMFRDWSGLQWFIQSSFTLSSVFIAIWLFTNIKYENRDKKLFRLIFQGKEWTPLMKSMDLLNQIEEYKVPKA